MWRTLGVIVIGGIVLYGGLVLLAYLLQDWFTYLPLRSITATPGERGLAYESVRFQSEDGLALTGWFVPGQPERAVVLFFHGNAGNISHRLDTLEILHELGLSVFIIDYRGYGESEGRPTERGTYRDAEAAWRYLVEERQIPPERIIIFGRSLGGAIATWLAYHHTPQALILESTFTSGVDIGAEIYPFLPVRWLIRERYNTRARLPQVECPVLIIHSSGDNVIPYHHGRELFALAPEPKQFLEISGGHNDGFLLAGSRYSATWEAFVSRYEEAR